MWTDETKVELFVKHIIVPFTENKMRPSKKRTLSLQSNMVEVHRCFWGCFAASGTGCPDCVHGIMKSEDYQIILERNVGPSVRKLGLHQRSRVFQKDNDPKHTSKSTQKWFKTTRWRVLKWPTMSPDLNPIEQRSPTPAPWTGTGPWVIWYRAAQKE